MIPLFLSVSFAHEMVLIQIGTNSDFRVVSRDLSGFALTYSTEDSFYWSDSQVCMSFQHSFLGITAFLKKGCCRCVFALWIELLS